MICTNLTVYNCIAWPEVPWVTHPKRYLSKFVRGLDRKILSKLTRCCPSTGQACVLFIEKAIYIVFELAAKEGSTTGCVKRLF